MKYAIGRSASKDPHMALREATSQLHNPKLILFFSGVEDFEEYAKKLKELFPNSITMGATTFASFSKEGAFKDSCMVLGIEEGIECEADVLEEVDCYPLKYVKRVERCVSKFNNENNLLCLEMTTALISSEELVLSTLNSVLAKKNIPLFGGSSGDRGRAEKTMISLNGKIYQNACAFVIIKNLTGKIKLYRENIYRPTRHQFIATKVDARKRLVYEYNNQPAALVMAKALGTEVSNLHKYLDSYPLGRVIGNEMYITANEAVQPGNAMTYHARIYKNSKMVLLEPDNYKEVLKRTREQVKTENKKPSLALMVNCLARSMLFEQEGYLNQFAIDMGEALGNYIGFAGYGEQLGEQHFNQTMILAVFE